MQLCKPKICWWNCKSTFRKKYYFMILLIFRNVLSIPWVFLKLDRVYFSSCPVNLCEYYSFPNEKSTCECSVYMDLVYSHLVRWNYVHQLVFEKKCPSHDWSWIWIPYVSQLVRNFISIFFMFSEWSDDPVSVCKFGSRLFLTLSGQLMSIFKFS